MVRCITWSATILRRQRRLVLGWQNTGEFDVDVSAEELLLDDEATRSDDLHTLGPETWDLPWFGHSFIRRRKNSVVIRIAREYRYPSTGVISWLM